MSANDWYKPSRELTPEEMMSPWVVTDVSEVTPDRVEAYFAASGKHYSGAYRDVTALAKAIRVAWRGHLVDHFVPNKNGAVLLDHLIAFANKNEGAVNCFAELAPTAQPNCFLSRIGDVPVIVYGERCFVLENNKLADKNGVDTSKLNPLADFALKKKYPDVADAYITALNKLSDFRIVVAIDKALYDKDFGIVDRIAGEGLRPVVVKAGPCSAGEMMNIAELKRYREVYRCEEFSLLPVCIGKNRSIFISDNKELCEGMIFCGSKVIAAGCECKGAAVTVAQDKINEVDHDLVIRQFVRVERTVG